MSRAKLIPLATNFGKRLETLRKDSGLLQKDLALDLDCTREWINRLETGKRKGLTLPFLIKLSQFFEIDPKSLIGQPLPEAAPKNPRREKMDVGNGFPRRLKAARLHRGLTQKSICDEMALNPAQFSFLETGKDLPTKHEFYTLAKILRVEVNWFFGGKDEKEPKLREELKDTNNANMEK